MQRLRRRFSVVHHGDANIVGPRIAAVILVARRIAARQDPHARLPPEPDSGGLAAAQGCDVEPEEKAPGRPPVAVPIANDLIREIEFLPVEVAIRLDVNLVAVSRDGDLLRRNRHLRGRDGTQFEELRYETTIPHGKADAQPGQI